MFKTSYFVEEKIWLEKAAFRWKKDWIACLSNLYGTNAVDTDMCRPKLYLKLPVLYDKK